VLLYLLVRWLMVEAAVGAGETVALSFQRGIERADRPAAGAGAGQPRAGRGGAGAPVA